MLAGFPGPGTVLLAATLALIAAVCFARPAAPGNPAWEVVAGWQLVLAAVAAVTWQRGRRRSPRRGYQQERQNR
jgi:hypothetical protein